MAGNNVSHAKNRTKRRFIPNLRRVSWHGETLNAPLRLRVSAQALRSVEHCGGIEAYLLKTSNDRLSPKARHFKKRLLKRQKNPKAKN